MLGKFKSIFRGRTPPPKAQVKARFDAAQTNHDNFKHWQAADFLSADAEASSEVRKTLRTRARYEISNNSYARGVVLTLANDSVGIGPRLQMLSDRDEINRQLESDFMSWSREVRLAEKLRTIRMARCQDGEAFILLAQNPKLTNTNVKLDLQLIEADRVTNELYLSDINSIDGIIVAAVNYLAFYNLIRANLAHQNLGTILVLPLNF